MSALALHVRELDAEQVRCRDRLHVLESGVQAIRYLTEQIKLIPEQMTQVAREAIRLDRRERGQRDTRLVGTWTQMLSLMVGAAGAAAVIVSLLSK